MEEALRALLIADADITALVGARVFPLARAPGTGLPALTYQIISGGPEYAADGETGLTQNRVQLNCWGKTYTSAKDLAREVRARLSDFRGTVSGVEFHSAFLDDQRDLRESGGGEAEYLFRTQLDFIIWHDN